MIGTDGQLEFPKLYTTFAKYYDRLESQYRDYALEAKWLSEILGNAKEVIDLSCGTANHVKGISSASTSKEIFAMDSSKEMIEIAESKKGKSFRLLRSDFLHPPFRSESFDAAICMYWSLAGLNEELVQQLFNKTGRILRKNAMFVFDVENAEGIKENLIGAPFIDSFFEDGSTAVIRANFSTKVERDLVDWRAYYLLEQGGVSELVEDRMQLRFYSRKQLENLLCNAGFRVEQVLSGPYKEYEQHSPSLYFIARKN